MLENKIRASVAMAVYNGENYIKEQLDSIIEMMGAQDEIVISYDSSKDNTWDIISEYADRDSRIICVKNDLSKGVCGNFTNACSHCRGKYIFLSDQDDVWIDNKIDRMIDELEKSGADMAVHDGYFVDRNLNILPTTFFGGRIPPSGPIANFIKGRFWGCAMVFRREMMQILLPFPENIAHDIYASILVGLKGKIQVVDHFYIKHRVHEENVTPQKHAGLLKLFIDRGRLFINICMRLSACRRRERRELKG